MCHDIKVVATCICCVATYNEALKAKRVLWHNFLCRDKELDSKGYKSVVTQLFVSLPRSFYNVR